MSGTTPPPRHAPRQGDTWRGPRRKELKISPVGLGLEPLGLDINAVHLLIGAVKRYGACLGEVLTIGRPELNVYPQKMAQVLKQHQLPSGPFQGTRHQKLYAEPFFYCLGARKVRALDASDFEGADLLYDLNQPVNDLKEAFDTVYDGGTLEHVFNFPTALKSCMEMVKLGGRFFSHAPTNNWCGHGFYQLSPELFFRAFSPPNGFVIERVIIHRAGPFNQWYEVSDPDLIQSRVELITFTPTVLLVQARRTQLRPIFDQPPQQGDYLRRWKGPSPPETSRKISLFPNLARLLHALREACAIYRDQTLRNRKKFRPIPK